MKTSQSSTRITNYNSLVANVSQFQNSVNPTSTNSQTCEDEPEGTCCN